MNKTKIKEYYQEFRKLYDSVYSEISEGKEDINLRDIANEIIFDNDDSNINQADFNISDLQNWIKNKLPPLNIIKDLPKEMNNLFTSIQEKISNLFSQLDPITIGSILGVSLIFGAFLCKAVKDSSQPPSVKTKEALCLVVNAKHLHGIKIAQDISIEQIKKLIDEATFFLCTSEEKLNQIEANLRIRNEDPLNYDLQEFYVSIVFDQPLNMINEKRKYTIKDKIDTNYKYLKISKINYLESVEGFTEMGFTIV